MPARRQGQGFDRNGEDERSTCTPCATPAAGDGVDGGHPLVLSESPRGRRAGLGRCGAPVRNVCERRDVSDLRGQPGQRARARPSPSQSHAAASARGPEATTTCFPDTPHVLPPPAQRVPPESSRRLNLGCCSRHRAKLITTPTYVVTPDPGSHFYIFLSAREGQGQSNPTWHARSSVWPTEHPRLPLAGGAAGWPAHASTHRHPARDRALAGSGAALSANQRQN